MFINSASYEGKYSKRYGNSEADIERECYEFCSGLGRLHRDEYMGKSLSLQAFLWYDAGHNIMIVRGKVVEGSKKGRENGFPTANIANSGVKPGIYMGFVTFGDDYLPGAVYVGGWRPEILEAHIINWKGDLYGREIEVEVGDKIREDMTFHNAEELKAQIKADIKEIQRLCFQG